jgi:hypothetical protein
LNLRPLRPEARSVSRRGREVSVNSARGGVPESTRRRPGSHSVGHSAASSRILRKLRMKPCSRRCVRLWTNTDKAASEVVAVFDALRNPQADSSMPGGLATASDGLRALMGCGDVQALPPPFSPGRPQFAPLPRTLSVPSPHLIHSSRPYVQRRPTSDRAERSCCAQRPSGYG